MPRLGDLLEELREALHEATPVKSKVRKARSAAKVQRRVCPAGTYQIQPGKCIRKPPGMLRKEKVRKARWRRSAAGKKSATISAKYRRRYG